MWPDLPFELNVVGTPVSFQGTNRRAREEWKAKVLEAARAALDDGAWAFDERRLAMTMFYFPQARMQGDVDNIVKLTVDALKPAVYLDDVLIDRIVIQRFDQTSVSMFVEPSDILLHAVALTEPALYIRIEDAPLEGIVP